MPARGTFSCSEVITLVMYTVVNTTLNATPVVGGVGYSSTGKCLSSHEKYKKYIANKHSMDVITV